jgi:predicted transcriptional regulator
MPPQEKRLPFAGLAALDAALKIPLAPTKPADVVSRKAPEQHVPTKQAGLVLNPPSDVESPDSEESDRPLDTDDYYNCSLAQQVALDVIASQTLFASLAGKATQSGVSNAWKADYSKEVPYSEVLLAIRELVESGWIVEESDEKGPEGKTRVFYSLTEEAENMMLDIIENG